MGPGEYDIHTFPPPDPSSGRPPRWGDPDPMPMAVVRMPRLLASFAAWVLVGGLWGLSAVGILTIGLFVAPVALIASLLVGRLVRERSARPGVLLGVAGVPGFVGISNWGGPGMSCSTSSSGSSCSQLLNPWPWLAAAAILAGCGIGVFVLLQRHH